MTILIDTNVLSEVRRPRPSIAVIRWLDQLGTDEACVSVVTFAEIKRGISQLQSGRRKRELASWLETDLMSRFADRVLSIDLSVALAWGDLMSECRRRGSTMTPLDGMIAATARVHDLRIATRNTSDFSKLGIELVDPWKT